MTKNMHIPNSRESEYTVLACMLSSYNAYNLGVEKLTRADFFYTEHQAIFEAMLSCYDKHQAVDSYLILQTVADRKVFEPVGGDDYIRGMTMFSGSTYNVDAYIRELQEVTTKRQLLQRARDIERLTQEEMDSKTMLDKSSAWITSLAIGEEKTSYTAEELIKAAPETYMQRLQREQEEAVDRAARGIKFAGIPFGFSRLDERIGGLKGPDLIVVGARPGVGKSAFALNVMYNVVKQGHKALFLSLEMGNDQVLERLLALDSLVPHWKIKNRSFSGLEYQMIFESSERLQSYPLILDDQQSQTVSAIAAKCRRFATDGDLKLIVIDYLGLVSDQKDFGTKALAIADITRRLKMLAKELNCCVLLLCQLNRDTAKEDRKPVLSDLRDSGAIEQDADAVILIHRENMYVEGGGTQVDYIVAKNRHGQIGTIDGFCNMEIYQMSAYKETIAERMKADQVQCDEEMNYFLPEGD